MILKRKAYQKLLDWKNECNGARALMVEGAVIVNPKLSHIINLKMSHLSMC